jgi:hypothetical protein
MIAASSLPIASPALRLARSMSPVETWTMP